MKNFTEGPWETFVSFEWPDWLTVCNTKSPMDEIAIIMCSHEERDKGCPNADLIAAAPELYEFLREACFGSCIHCNCHEGIEIDDIQCTLPRGRCTVQRWRKLLQKIEGGTK